MKTNGVWELVTKRSTKSKYDLYAFQLIINIIGRSGEVPNYNNKCRL